MGETWPAPKNRTLRSLRTVIVCALGFVVVWAPLLVLIASGSDDQPGADGVAMAVGSGMFCILIALCVAFVCAVIWFVEHRR